MPKSPSDKADWRVFCAVELPNLVQDAIRLHINTLKAKLPGAKPSWSRPEKTHLTLKFFGNVNQSRIPQISMSAERAVMDFKPFQIVIGGTGVFPGVSRARVLWIGVSELSEREQILSQLQKRFDAECVKEGFPKEDRTFRPHLTVARVRRPEGSRELAEAHIGTRFQEVIVEVSQLIVFRSELSSNGSKYTALSKHPLKVR